MQRYLERKAYDRLKAWKESGNHSTLELFLEKYHELRRQISGALMCENLVYELIRQYCPDFKDSKETIVIIDEIQESAEIYNRIREFTRKLESDFIVTGSYLGRILNKEFKYSSPYLNRFSQYCF